MAGDWIKMGVDLPEKPEVWQIAGMVGIEPDLVVGKLLKVWRWFDAHTESGNALGVTFALVDSLVSVTGFAEAMTLCGWLEQDGCILRCPNFDRHNGKTAKNRALTAKRAAGHREKSNAISNGASVTSALPREEKRREEKKEEEQAPEIFIPLDDGTEHPITATAVAEYRQAYPRIDVLAELRKARVWSLDNPANRKTRRGVGKFVNGWLSRADADAAKRAPQPTRQRRQL